MNQLTFKNMTLKRRMIAAFVFMGLIILIIALIGWNGTNRLGRDIDVLANDVLPSTVALWKINEGQTQILSYDRALLNGTTSFEIREKEKARIQDAWKQINAGFNEYEKIPRNSEEEKLYQEFKPLWERWKASHENFVELNQEFEKYGILNPRQVQLNLLSQAKGNDPKIAPAKMAVIQALRAINSSIADLNESAQNLRQEISRFKIN